MIESAMLLALEAVGVEPRLADVDAGAEDAGADGLGQMAGDGANGDEFGADGGEVGLVGLLGLAQRRDGDVGPGRAGRG